jgi:hypothetical protein
MATEFRVTMGVRARGSSPVTLAEDWLQFLTAGGRYNKTIRTLEEAKASGSPVVVYPDVTDVTQFYVYKGDGDVLIHLKYEDGGFLNELKEGGGAALAEENKQIILLSDLKKTLGIQAGGRRRSRKAKKNKAHTPQ